MRGCATLDSLCARSHLPHADSRVLIKLKKLRNRNEFIIEKKISI